MLAVQRVAHHLRQPQAVLPVARLVEEAFACLAHAVPAAGVAQARGGHVAEQVLRDVDRQRVGGVVRLTAGGACDADAGVAHDVVQADVIGGARFFERARGGDDVDRCVADRVDVVRARQRHLVREALADQERGAGCGDAAALVGVQQRFGLVGRQVGGARSRWVRSGAMAPSATPPRRADGSGDRAHACATTFLVAATTAPLRHARAARAFAHLGHVRAMARGQRLANEVHRRVGQALALVGLDPRLASRSPSGQPGTPGAAASRA